MVADQKVPMQADGGGKHGSAEDSTGRGNGGDSGGGPYPNPHTDKKPKDGFLGQGGQTEINEKDSGGST